MTSYQQHTTHHQPPHQVRVSNPCGLWWRSITFTPGPGLDLFIRIHLTTRAWDWLTVPRFSPWIVPCLPFLQFSFVPLSTMVYWRYSTRQFLLIPALAQQTIVPVIFTVSLLVQQSAPTYCQILVEISSVLIKSVMMGFLPQLTTAFKLARKHKRWDISRDFNWCFSGNIKFPHFILSCVGGEEERTAER